jgi:hypothetical protein
VRGLQRAKIARGLLDASFIEIDGEVTWALAISLISVTV